MQLEVLNNSPPLISPDQIKICKYSDLDERMQQIALDAIEVINNATSTEPGKTWDNYTVTIRERLRNCKNAKNTFFIAQVGEKIVGYAAFFTKQDGILYPSKFLKTENEAYCSWTAIDENYKGKGISMDLKLQIFNAEHNITEFKGHMKKTNAANIRVLEKIGLKYQTTLIEVGHQYLYSVKNRLLSA